MSQRLLPLLALLALLLNSPAVKGDDAPDPHDLTKWQITGAEVTVDSTNKHSTSAGSFKIPPEATATLPLRTDAGSGSVTLWIFDDGTAPSNPEAIHHLGPRWGLIGPDGHVLFAGILYAAYLKGEKGYVANDVDLNAKEPNWFQDVVWLSTERVVGWHKWVFKMDPNTGLTISADGEPLTNFDWNKTQFKGFTGIVLYGEENGSDHPQTYWVDDIDVTLGGPMVATPGSAPSPAAPTPPATPASP